MKIRCNYINSPHSTGRVIKSRRNGWRQIYNAPFLSYKRSVRRCIAVHAIRLRCFSHTFLSLSRALVRVCKQYSVRFIRGLTDPSEYLIHLDPETEFWSSEVFNFPSPLVQDGKEKPTLYKTELNACSVSVRSIRPSTTTPVALASKITHHSR